ncbi:MAG TPA: histidine phosphatase family protein [bacterium]|nr:histidine phosphatase family protein [bacterium]
MRPTRLYLLRHGETTWNLARRYQGTLDSPLSEAGRAQTLRLREALRGAPLRAVYSSPLPRAAATAAAVAAPHGLPVLHCPGLAEIRVGEWEGLTVSEIEARHGEVMRRWHEAPHQMRLPGGETLEELRARAWDAIADLRRRHAGEAVAAVAHGGVNKAILLTVLGAPLASYWRIRQGNACINIIDFTGDRGVVMTMNDTTHLRGAAPSASPPAPVRSPETW